jgi:hypothetical protein
MRSIKLGQQSFVKGTYALTSGISTENVLIKNDTVTGSIRLPKGLTGDRINPVSGDIRYNTTTNFIEYYDGTDWRSIAFQQNQTITKDSFTGDGVEDTFGPLTFTPASVNNILVFIQNVFQVGSSNYDLRDSLDGTTPPLNYIRFGSIPPLNHSIIVLHGFDKT